MRIIGVSFSLWVAQTHVSHCAAFLPTLKPNSITSFNKSTRLNYTNQIPDTTDPYDILNLPRGIISHQSITRAYNEMAKKYHPSHRLSQSTSPKDKERIEMEFQRIHAAYEYLINRKRIDAGAAADGIGKVKVTIGMNGDPIVKGQTHNSNESKRKKKNISYEEWDTWDPNNVGPDAEESYEPETMVAHVQEETIQETLEHPETTKRVTNVHEENCLEQDNEERKTVILTEFLNKLHTLSESPITSSKYFDKIHAVNSNGTLVSLDLGSHVQLVSEEINHLEQHAMEIEQLVSDIQDLQDMEETQNTGSDGIPSDSSSLDPQDAELDSKPLESKPNTQGKRLKINKAMELLSRNGNGSYKTQPKHSNIRSTASSPVRTYTVRSDGPLPNSNIRHLKDEFESVKRHLEESKKAIRVQLDEIEKDKKKFASLGKELEERENYMREKSHSHGNHHEMDDHTNQRLDLGGPSTSTFESQQRSESEIHSQERVPNIDPAIEVLNNKVSEFVAAKELNTKINRLLRDKKQLHASVSSLERNDPNKSSEMQAITKKGLVFYPAIENMGTDMKMLFLAHMFTHSMKKSKVVAFYTLKQIEPTKVHGKSKTPTESSDVSLKSYHPSRGILNLELQKLIIQHMYAHLAQIRLRLKKGDMVITQFQLPPQTKSEPQHTKRPILDPPRPSSYSDKRTIPPKPVLPPKPTSKLQSEPEAPLQILHILPDTSDPFAILNLKKGEVNLAVIKRAYRQMAKICHPDKRMYINSSSKQRQVANEEFARVNAAYAYLTGKSQTLDVVGKTEYGEHGKHKNTSKDDFYNYYRKPESQHSEYAPSHKFQKGDYVNIISGPHTDSHGTIMSIYPNMLKVEVNLSMSVFCMLHEVELDKSWHRQREQRQTTN
jgi:transcription antitermination factor NusG